MNQNYLICAELRESLEEQGYLVIRIDEWARLHEVLQRAECEATVTFQDNVDSTV